MKYLELIYWSITNKRTFELFLWDVCDYGYQQGFIFNIARYLLKVRYNNCYWY